ncbi:MAG: hypothetical protein PHS54_04745 [Clostridia bacterium]|nr:hypothetical protein [Clostridia bacterium]
MSEDTCKYFKECFCGEPATAIIRSMPVCKKHYKELRYDNERRFKRNVDIPCFDENNPEIASQKLPKKKKRKTDISKSL